MVWKGSEAAGNQCEQSTKEAWKIKGNPYTKGRKDKTKIKEVEENWEIGRNGKGGRKKRSYWTRAMAWLQQLAPDVTLKLLVLYVQIREGNLVRLTVVFRRS